MHFQGGTAYKSLNIKLSMNSNRHSSFHINQISVTIDSKIKQRFKLNLVFSQFWLFR